MENTDGIHKILLEVEIECQRAMGLHDDGGHAAMNGPHEAYAVILEEMDEYWDEVKRYNPNKPGRDTRPRQREELIQLAAMAIRAIYDTIDHGKVYPGLR
jgi:hypothetical protein